MNTVGSSTPTNRLAVWALIVSFFVNVAGIVLGIFALRQIRETAERGKGFAIGAIVIGSIGVLVLVPAFIVGLRYALESLN